MLDSECTGKDYQLVHYYTGTNIGQPFLLKLTIFIPQLLECRLWGFGHSATKSLVSFSVGFSGVEVRTLCKAPALANHDIMELTLFTGLLYCLNRFGPLSTSEVKL